MQSPARLTRQQPAARDADVAALDGMIDRLAGWDPAATRQPSELVGTLVRREGDALLHAHIDLHLTRFGVRAAARAAAASETRPTVNKWRWSDGVSGPRLAATGAACAREGPRTRMPRQTPCGFRSAGEGPRGLPNAAPPALF